MNNQRGGIISKVFLVPAGALVVVVVFLLGYFAGRYQERKAAEGEKPASLPELASQYLPKKEDLTFYKTLTERGEKTVSIDLKPKEHPEKEKTAHEPAVKEGGKTADSGRQKQEKQIEIRIDRTKPDQKQKGQKTKQSPEKKEGNKDAVVASALPSKLRYTVQIASYPERGQAEEAVKDLKRRGYAAFVAATELPDKGTWYRVRLGSFANKTSAEKLAKELKSKEGLAPIITAE